jgi:hypothetical protein
VNANNAIVAVSTGGVIDSMYQENGTTTVSAGGLVSGFTGLGS